MFTNSSSLMTQLEVELLNCFIKIGSTSFPYGKSKPTFISQNTCTNRTAAYVHNNNFLNKTSIRKLHQEIKNNLFTEKQVKNVIVIQLGVNNMINVMYVKTHAGEHMGHPALRDHMCSHTRMDTEICHLYIIRRPWVFKPL